MKNQRGITLIALVITIIVLLILAGVAIAMLSGKNGILSNAKDSAKETAISSAKEQIGLIVNEAITDYYKNVYVEDNTTGNNASVQKAVVAALNDGEKIKEDSYQHITYTKPSTETSGSPVTFTIKYKDDGETWTGSIDENGLLTWSKQGS